MLGSDAILNRTLLYRKLTQREGQAPVYELLDWCIVTTRIGSMIEPRTLIRATGNMQNSDVYDSGFNAILEADDQTLGQVGFGGTQWPRTYNVSY